MTVKRTLRIACRKCGEGHDEELPEGGALAWSAELRASTTWEREHVKATGHRRFDRRYLGESSP